MVLPVWYIMSIGIAIAASIFVYTRRNVMHPHQMGNPNYHDNPPNGGNDHLIRCTICQNTRFSPQIIQLNCGHSFHRQCFNQWITDTEQNYCPVCL